MANNLILAISFGFKLNNNLNPILYQQLHLKICCATIIHSYIFSITGRDINMQKHEGFVFTNSSLRAFLNNKT